MKRIGEIPINLNGGPQANEVSEELRMRIVAAVSALSNLKFFPAGQADRVLVMTALERIVRDEKQLNWLVETLLASVEEWPGIAQTRALLATEFTPPPELKQPIPACTIPGFTPDDLEARALYGRIAQGTRAQAKRLAAPSCCSGTGITDGAPQVTGGPPSFAWCGCAAGTARQAREPGYIAGANSGQLDLLHRFGQGAAVTA